MFAKGQFKWKKSPFHSGWGESRANKYLKGGMESLCDLFVRRQVGTSEFSPAYLFLPGLYKLNTFLAKTYIISALMRQFSRSSFFFFLNLCTHMAHHTVYNFVWISAQECLNKWLEHLMSLTDDHQPLWMQNGIQKPGGLPSWSSLEITMPMLMQRPKFKKKEDGKLHRTC